MQSTQCFPLVKANLYYVNVDINKCPRHFKNKTILKHVIIQRETPYQQWSKLLHNQIGIQIQNTVLNTATLYIYITGTILK